MKDDYRDWALRAKSGDGEERREAFERLARDFQGMAYSLAYVRLSDAQMAEDAAQEALLAAYKQIDQLQDVGAFPSWLRRIVMTQADRITRKRSIGEASIELAEGLESGALSPEEALEAGQMRQRVRDAVDALPEKERVVTRDYYFAGESQREISERLDVPLGTVKKRLQYAREHLRGIISGFNDSFNDSLGRAMQGEEGYRPAYVRIRAKRRWRGPSKQR